MGLYSLACAALNKNRHEYVHEYEHEYIDSLFTDFHRMADEIRLTGFAVLFSVNSGYKIILNKGFNAETVRKSVSTADFWNGMLQDETWHFIKGEALNPFFQLFSAYDASFDCLSIKKTSHKGCPFIFIAAGEIADVFLQKQLDALMPLIERTYTILHAFYKPVDIVHQKTDFSVQAKERFKSGKASLYIVKLNKLFESLFALLAPSDFDFITSCIGAAPASFTAESPLCFSADDESRLYFLTRDKEGGDFCSDMKNAFKKMFSQKRADFMCAEPASEESSLYKELSNEIAF